MRTLITSIVAVIALTVMAPGHATAADTKAREVQCLAQNIYYEARNEPEEGKVAVGLVTINRTQDPRFPDSVCGVVHQRTVLNIPKKVTEKHEVTREVPREDFLGRLTGATVTTTEIIAQTVQKVQQVAICQFSWTCMHLPGIKHDERWAESQRIAEELLAGGYEELRNKYLDILYFHATAIHPSWRSEKRQVVRIGGHVFYAER